MSDWRTYQELTINGRHYDKKALLTLAHQNISITKEAWKKDLYRFILEWLNDDDFITVQTSGSTGKPKQIKLHKNALVFSAKNTLNALNIEAGQTTFLCIPTKYIGGKMMVVRAFVGALDLSYKKPSSRPFKALKNSIDFAAITPQQASASPVEELEKINKIIVGGGNINNLLSSKLKNINSTIYSTYGMTETASHIALRNISKSEDFFTVLEDISIQKDERDCLVISAPNLSNETILTNDVVDILSDKTFVWKGRYDNVINSGGIKVFPEAIEQKLSTQIDARFFIHKQPSDKLGEKVVLVIESKTPVSSLNFDDLEFYEKPKEVLYVTPFEETENGKVQREKTLKKVI